MQVGRQWWSYTIYHHCTIKGREDVCACFSFSVYSGEGIIFSLTTPYDERLATMNSKVHSAIPQKVLQAIRIFVLGLPSISWGNTCYIIIIPCFSVDFIITITILCKAN